MSCLFIDTKEAEFSRPMKTSQSRKQAFKLPKHFFRLDVKQNIWQLYGVLLGAVWSSG